MKLNKIYRISINKHGIAKNSNHAEWTMGRNLSV